MISSESDFFVANEKRLLPRHDDGTSIAWGQWKKFVRELIKSHDPARVHPRFLRSELRLGRLNTVYWMTHPPTFRSYFGRWNTYSSLFLDNLKLLAAATIFIVLVLNAMQVGLRTDRLQNNAIFQQASYGFVVFAILAPICAFSAVALLALLNLLKDLPRLWEEVHASSLSG